MYWFGAFVVCNVLLVTLLAINVSRLRVVLQVTAGDGGHVALLRAIRAHGNAVEHTTIFALVVLALELAGTAGAILGPLVMAFTLGRLVHARGMLARGAFNWRRVGAGLTYLLELAGVGLLLAAM